jgi:hypothetical protein
MPCRFRVCVAALAGWLAASAAAAAETLRVTYAISLIGLPIGTGTVKVDLSPTHYAIDAQGKLNALASLIVNSRGASQSSGALVNGRLSPASFATTAVSSKMTRTIRMSLKDNAVAGVDIAPPFDEKPDRVPLRPQDTHNIIDPASAYLVPAPKSGPPVSVAACQRTLPIFDGYTRFDLALAYVGEKQVSAKGYNGPAAVCSVRYVPVAGHRQDRPATKFMAENKEIEIWLAPVAGTSVLVPFRLSVKTMIGMVALEATDFAVGK